MYITFAFILFWREDPRFGLLNRAILPDRRWIAQRGAAITVAGGAFAIWARWHIGRNWSAEVTTKQDHTRIRTGPYAHIRHPMYTGILLAALGTALAIERYRGLASRIVPAIGFALKAKREENFLSREFGPAFDEHERQTGFFLPRFSSAPHRPHGRLEYRIHSAVSVSPVAKLRLLFSIGFADVADGILGAAPGVLWHHLLKPFRSALCACSAIGEATI